MTSSYCVKCKHQTATVGGKLTVSKNGKNMVKGKCAECGSNKSTFTGGSVGKAGKQGKKKGKGFLDFLL
ncbi:MAG: DUF5679 domain-containing protein [Clostridium sp.]|nr:DUF5679 domain-containing protein [Clostridium sp.]